MLFQDIAKRVRAEASTHGISVPMSKLNDAIALACYGKKYAAVVAAENAGKLAEIPKPPPHIASVARQYRMDEYAFGLSLRTGIEGRLHMSSYGVVDQGMEWLQATHNAELQRLEHEEFDSLVDPEVKNFLMLNSGYQGMCIAAFAEWVIAEGEIQVEGVLLKVSDLMLHSKSRPAWSAKQRAYITAIAAAPLRPYLVESVAAGFNLTLRPLGASDSGLLQVAERSASDPDLIGTVIAARVIAQHDHLELAGGTLSFNSIAEWGLADIVRRADTSSAASRAIRSAWFQQFNQPLPNIVLADTGDEVRLVTDFYHCPSIELLTRKLEADKRVTGNKEYGWSLEVEGGDRRKRLGCSINQDDEISDQVSVFYMSEAAAEKWRPWFEELCSDAVSFLSRESLDPYEAAMDAAMDERFIEAEQMHQSILKQIPTDVLSSYLADAFRQTYDNFADMPLSVLDGLSPREMLKRTGGEARVRELIANYESNEHRMSREDNRPPISFDFLYQKIGLAKLPEFIASRGKGLHPNQFEDNQAWIVFKLSANPIHTTDAGDVLAIGLIDAASTHILNYKLLPEGTDFSEDEARVFFHNLKFATPPRPPRQLFISSDISTVALRTEAARFDISVADVDELDLQGIVTAAKESFDEQYGEMFGFGRRAP